MDLENDERERVHALLQAHGWNATSFQILEPGFRYWFDEASQSPACVAYVDTGDAWVAAGAPIAADPDLAKAAERFVEAAHAEGKLACFFGTESRFTELSKAPHLCIGEQPVWDPSEWTTMLSRASSLREQLRRAKAKGVAVREIDPNEFGEASADSVSPLRKQVELLLTHWLASRKMAPMGFLVGVELFAHASARRYFAAERNGELVALLAAVPIYARNGWLVEDLLRDPRAPNGTAELLIDAAMRAFAEAGSRYATMGLAPLAGEVGSILKTAREWGALLYDFDGVRAFKARLRPNQWDPIYLVYPDGSSVRAMRAVLRAFAGGGLVRFGLQTVLRGPPLVVRLLAVLLVPWTLALGLADHERWFPSRRDQIGWIVFDLVLGFSLFTLSRKWRTWLAWVLAFAISADALVTLLEAITFNLPRLHKLFESAVVGTAVSMPMIAAAVLFGALFSRSGRWR